MNHEFTGERVIPGQVDVSLWHEHFSRYAFAARLARHRRVLDAGCGTAYGAAELAHTARSVTGIDLSADAIAYAGENFRLPNLRFTQASCTALPFRNASFDLVTAFEVIEHLPDWPDLLTEARRVLAPGGQFVLSTPNKSFYSESRGVAGSNPFHVHEFELDEFRGALAEHFPDVLLFVQDYTEGLLFRAPGARAPAEVRIEPAGADPSASFFFIAVCAMSPQTGAPTFVYLPSGANLLAERNRHIAKLEAEVDDKTAWLAKQQADHQELLALFRKQQADLETANEWARQQENRIQKAAAALTHLQAEMQALRDEATNTAAEYEKAVQKLETELAERTEWALANEARLTEERNRALNELAAKCDELKQAVDALHQTEAELEQRTQWALELDHSRSQLDNQLQSFVHSRWVRLGRAVGLGPKERSAN